MNEGAARIIRFSPDFESGNGVEFHQVGEDVYQFEIRPDTNASDRQWFHFRVQGARGRTLTFHLLHLSRTNIPEHWELSRPVASANGRDWNWTSGPMHVDAAGDAFHFAHTFTSDHESIAFHFPYTYSDHLKRLAAWKKHPAVTHEVIGKTVEGRPIDLLRVMQPGLPESERIGLWACARAHAGETAASFTFEGFLNFLLSDNAGANGLRRRAVFNLVPMMNPDGVVAGNYRTNLAGVNLNRVWHDPSAETSPENLAVRAAIDRWVASRRPYHFFIDFHADSCASAYYLFHPDGTSPTPKYHDPANYQRDVRRFVGLVAARNPDFDPIEGASQAEDEGIGYHQQRIGHGVLAFTPEAPYGLIKHGVNKGSPATPARHHAVGEAICRAVEELYFGTVPEDK